MRLLLVLPAGDLPGEQYERSLQAALEHLHPDSVRISAPQSFLEVHSKAWSNREMLPYAPSRAASENDAIVLVETPSGDAAPLPTPAAESGLRERYKVRLYRLSPLGRFTLLNQELDAQEYPFLTEHVFNRLSHSLNEGFCLFPYGYLYRYPGMGPIDELGHRIGQNLTDVEGRDANRMLVAVFGGSATFSINCRHSEMFAARLERKLNEHCARISAPFTFSVLNFGVPGHVVLNELTTFNLFCHRLRPQIVIAHDGYNDFYYGQLSDPYLLNSHALTYQNIHEKWSQMLFKSNDVPLTWSEDKEPWWENKLTILNYPRSIVRAYSQRQLQFQQIATAAGTSFVAGLQPSLFSRKRKSPQERVALQRQLSGMYGAIHKGIPFLYEKYLEYGSYRSLRHFVDFTRHFGDMDDSSTLFADCVHTLPAGDELIAQIYSDYICAELLSDVTRCNGAFSYDA